VLLLSLPLTGRSEPVSFPEPNWSREAAFAALSRSDSRPALAELFRLARQGDNSGLVAAIARIRANHEVNDPARDRLMHTFAAGLGDLPPGSVSQAVWDRLLSYRPATWVPDEHHPAVGVPLYNVRAAAAGSLNEWKRMSAWSEGERLLNGTDGAWITAWENADPARRRGLVDGLQGASPDRLSQLGRAALEGANDSPGLSAVAARAALLARDPDLFRRAVSHGGPGLSAALRDAAGIFDAAATADILRHVMTTAAPETGALAMAQLAPPLLEEPEVAALMMESLAHRDLGSSAALVLAGSEDPVIHAELARLAKDGKALEKQRAALSVQLAEQRSREDLR
jgi:hypothetical protein